MIDGNIDVVELNGDLIDYVSIEGELLPIGPKGDKGDPGDPGFSPQVDISKVGNATTLTIVDQQGTHQSVIYDGNGDMNKAVYDTDNDGVVDNAEMVNNHTVLSDVPADAVFTDTTYTAGTGIEITSGNVINNTQTSAEWGNITGTLANQTDLQGALDDKADASSIPTKVSDLNNDTGFITKAVDDLTNYYTTSNTYTKTEVNTLISQIPGFAIQIVQTLPVSDIDTHTIYLVPSSSAGTQNVYDEFIYVNNAWEQIGSTAIDLTNYPTFTDYPTAGGKAGVIKNGYSLTVGNTGVPSAEVHTAYDYGLRDDHIFISKGTLENVLTNKSYATTTALTNGLATKQDTLVSGTNIKTINNNSLLGSGNLTLESSPEVAVSTTQPSNGELIWIDPNEEYQAVSGGGCNFKLLTGTFTATYDGVSSNGSIQLELPSGYTVANSMMISATLQYDNDFKVVLPYTDFGVAPDFNTTLISGTSFFYDALNSKNMLNIYFQASSSSYNNKQFTANVVIAKTTDFN